MSAIEMLQCRECEKFYKLQSVEEWKRKEKNSDNPTPKPSHIFCPSCLAYEAGSGGRRVIRDTKTH